MFWLNDSTNNSDVIILHVEEELSEEEGDSGNSIVMPEP